MVHLFTRQCEYSLRGEFCRREITATTQPQWTSVTVTTSQTNITGNVYVPPVTETYNYDLDGNLTSDRRWTYKWDAENRLTNIVARTTVGPQLYIKFEYDWQGRRINKQVWTNTSGTGTASIDQKYLYDGWNVIAVLDTANALKQSYTWGTDLSGQTVSALNGAGGVGGLLWIKDTATISNATSCHFVAYDGNGNVKGLVNAADGTISAQYDYGPFGELIRQTGPMSKANPIRFSTKYQDDETDLLYYGFRYYNPSTGRWLSRDPIDEEGFIVTTSASGSSIGLGKQSEKNNVYSFVRNSPLAYIDRLGLECNTPVCGPNVTRPLMLLVGKLYRTWNSWSPAQQDSACDGLTSFRTDPGRGGGPAYLNAWDINLLWRGGQAWINSSPYCPPCATQPTCKNSVQVRKQCYYAGSVNYVLFGHMCKLCGFSKWRMTAMIWSYKHGAPNYTTSLGWAIAGYNGWPVGPAVQPPGDRSQCSATCPVGYSGPPFSFYWFPNGWN